MKQYFGETQPWQELNFHFCGWEKCAPGHSFGPAVRSHYLFHFILSGRGVYEQGGTRHTLKAGQGFLIVPGESTLYTADIQDPWEYCWMGFDGAAAPGLLHQCGLSSQTPVYTDQSGGQLHRQMQSLIETFEVGTPNPCSLLGNLYLCFSSMLMQQPVQQALWRTYAQRAVAFISSNYSYEIGVADIARHVGVDRTYLYRVFRQDTGCSPKEYLTQVRLKAAAQMLCDSQLSITEVAISCGFRELSAFDKHFRRSYNQTPLQYRQNAKTP